MRKKIELAPCIAIEENMPYKLRASLLLEKALKSKKGKSSENYKDDKMFITKSGIESLIGAGAKITTLNMKETQGGTFYHEVIYEEHKFITVTASPYVFKIQGCL